MGFYGFNNAPTVRKNHTVTGSHSWRRNIAITTNYHVLADRRPTPALLQLFRGYHDAAVLGLERHTVPFKDYP